MLREPTSIGPFQVIRKIATGGMAELFLCRQSGPGGFEKPLVVKRIHNHLSGDQEFIEMFVSEAKVAAGLHHPNIVQVIDFGQADGSYFIAMEYVDGLNLKTFIRRMAVRKLEIPIPLAIHILEQIAAALSCAHRAVDAQGRPLKIIHRDVSPQNILLSCAGEVMLADFGIVKVASRVGDSRAGVLKGKIAYMSPEQSLGRQLDGRSDVFSLGIVGFELLTGRRLFRGESDMETLDRVRESKIPSIRELAPSIPERLEEILLGTLTRDPERRYPSSEKLRQDLTALAIDLGCHHPATELGELISELIDDPTGRTGSGLSPSDPAEPTRTPTPVERIRDGFRRLVRGKGGS